MPGYDAPYALELMHELKHIDFDKCELKEDTQYRGCPFCEIDDGEIIENAQTRQAVFYRFKKCNRCSLVYPYPRPNKKTFEGYLKKEHRLADNAEQFAGSGPDRADRNEFHRRGSSFSKHVPLSYCYQDFTRYAKRGLKVLEIGAGPGYVSSLLQKKGCIVEAVEADPYRAGFLRNQMKVTVHEGRFEDAPLKDQSYDMVVMSQVLMHLYSIKETMQKIARILKPGGLLVSSQMNFNSIAQQTVRAPYPGRGLTAFTISSWFTPESMQNILRLSGFEVKKIMFRPSGLFGYVFPEGYPGGVFTNVVLKAINQLLKIILIRTRTSDYFTVVAIKRD